MGRRKPKENKNQLKRELRLEIRSYPFWGHKLKSIYGKIAYKFLLLYFHEKFEFAINFICSSKPKQTTAN